MKTEEQERSELRDTLGGFLYSLSRQELIQLFFRHPAHPAPLRLSRLPRSRMEARRLMAAQLSTGNKKVAQRIHKLIHCRIQKAQESAGRWSNYYMTALWKVLRDTTVNDLPEVKQAHYNMRKAILWLREWDWLHAKELLD